jgi:hypothetical protein
MNESPCYRFHLRSETDTLKNKGIRGEGCQFYLRRLKKKIRFLKYLMAGQDLQDEEMYRIGEFYLNNC